MSWDWDNPLVFVGTCVAVFVALGLAIGGILYACDGDTRKCDATCSGNTVGMVTPSDRCVCAPAALPTESRSHSTIIVPMPVAR